MDFPATLAVLNDVPSTFKRVGAPYAQLIDSLASTLSQFTLGEDATMTQVASFVGAVDGWLDVWGMLFGVPRNQGEANSTYATRVQRTVQAWVGTLPGIQAWLNFFAPGGSVTENAGLGFTLLLPSNMSVGQVSAFLVSLARIRPAGVPFTIQQVGAGLFLGTEAFLGTGSVIGSYLTAGTQAVTLAEAATTFSSQPLLPTLYLADPTINPSLAP